MKYEMPHIEPMELSKLSIADYVCHISNSNLVKMYVNEPIKLITQVPLLVSERDNKYFLIKGFEAFEAMKKLNQDNTFVQIAKFNSLDEEIEKYKYLNAENIPSIVGAVREELKNMTESYTFEDIINKMALYSRNTVDYFFDMLWYFIPDEYLYQTYKDVFNDAAQWFYSRLCEEDIVTKIHTLNKHDTVNNPVLIDLLDKDGYLTVYHGHCKPTLRNSHSWTIDPTIAHFFGCRNASRHGVEDYYIVTGKVKLKDIIAYITQRSENEIVVLNKFVKSKRKEYFKHSENKNKYINMFKNYNDEAFEKWIDKQDWTDEQAI